MGGATIEQQPNHVLGLFTLFFFLTVPFLLLSNVWKVKVMMVLCLSGWRQGALLYLILRRPG